MKRVLFLELPKKKGKFVCRYSFFGYAEKVSWTDGPFIQFQFRLRYTNLDNKSGAYLHQKHDKDNGASFSGSVIVELKGDENNVDRRLGLYHQGSDKYPSRMTKPFIEAWEI